MASGQTFSTNDLRSGAKEFQRDKEQRVKWAHGASFGPGRQLSDNRPRPARVMPMPKIDGPGDYHQKTRVAIKNDISYTSGDSSADEDVEEASAAPAPDADITYSYDASRGPSHGSQILSAALAKAVERFEDRETERVVKNEYEVLDSDGESVGGTTHKAGKKAVSAEEEDYEFV